RWLELDRTIHFFDACRNQVWVPLKRTEKRQRHAVAAQCVRVVWIHLQHPLENLLGTGHCRQEFVRVSNGPALCAQFHEVTPAEQIQESTIVRSCRHSLLEQSDGFLCRRPVSLPGLKNVCPCLLLGTALLRPRFGDEAESDQDHCCNHHSHVHGKSPFGDEPKGTAACSPTAFA